MDHNEEPDDAESSKSGPLRRLRQRKSGKLLPISMLEEAFARKSARAYGALSICVVVRTNKASWMRHLVGAAKCIANWDYVFDGGSNARQQAEQESGALDALARGGRVLCVGTSIGGITPRLLAAADIIVDVDRVSLSSVCRAIKSATNARPRGLRQADVDGLDLIDAMSAIRLNSTAADCVRRIRASRQTPTPQDNSLVGVPLISELAGYGAARLWADRLIADLERWRAGEIPFAAIERNVVLAGNPGCGKSTFVRSLARSTGLPLFASSIGQMFASTAGYLDSIVKAVDQLFASARAAGDTAIVFLDEIEGIPSRSTLDGRNASFWTPVINHFLTSLDSAMSAASVQLIVIGATNYPEKLDAALVRPGRLDKIIWIEQPNAEALSQIYRQHLGTDLPGHDLTTLAELAIGHTGADVVGHIKSARAQARSEGRPLGFQHLIDAVCPPSRLSPANQRRAAIHEAGHAVAAVQLGGHRVCNVVLGGAITGGRVTFERDRHSIGGTEEKRIEVIQLLAGRAAEECFMGSISAGAGGGVASDLGRATAIVAASHLSFGLRGTLAYLSDPDDAPAVLRRNPQLLKLVEEELQQHYQVAVELVRSNKAAVEAVADALVERRMLTGDEVRAIVGQFPAKRREAPHA